MTTTSAQLLETTDVADRQSIDTPRNPKPVTMRGKAEAAHVRRQKALDLRCAGARYRQIGKELGVSWVQAFRDVETALAETDAVTKKKAERLRDIDVARCERLIMSMTPKARQGDAKAVHAILHAMERAAKLLGTDAPERVLHAGMIIASEQLASARSSLDEKLGQLEQRMLGTGPEVIEAQPVAQCEGQAKQGHYRRGPV